VGLSWHDEYAKKYAGLLNEGQLLDLFDVIRSNVRSISGAARRCGIQRKTIYEMISDGKQVRKQTGERILRAALETNPQKSMEILLSKVVKDSEEIFLSYLSSIYQRAMQARGRADFCKATFDLALAMEKYPGLIVTGLQEETSSVISALAMKASSLGVEYDPPQLRVMQTEVLSAMVPALIEELLKTPRMDHVPLARKWHTDLSLITAVSKVIDENRAQLTFLPTQRQMIRDRETTIPETSYARRPGEIPLSSSSIERGSDIPLDQAASVATVVRFS